MKKVLTFAILIFASVLTFACKDGAKAQPNEPEQKEAKSGEVIVMNKDMFIKDVFDYEKSQDWKYKGDKPAIIDLYADWWSLPHDSTHHERSGKRIRRKDRDLQSECGQRT